MLVLPTIIMNQGCMSRVGYNKHPYTIIVSHNDNMCRPISNVHDMS